ncbi:MAG TPA: hypothetical protein VNL18_08165 [Gemmatimonadales bacterium]|nr:hypothetical protein [Gemmatimonadales bacterium]
MTPRRSSLSLAARKGPFHALIVSDSLGAAYLLPVSVQRDTVLALTEARPLDGLPPTKVAWVSLGSGDVDALLVTFDHRFEGVVGTLLLAIRGPRLEVVYRDEETSCQPAELRDIDGDGREELVSYVGDPSAGDCGDDCHIDFWKRFTMTPAWVRVQRWDGSAWVTLEREVGSFYAELATMYEQMQQWLETVSDA